MTREQAREHINSLLTHELTKAPKIISGHDTFICPFCGNGSGTDGTGISTANGKQYSCFKGCFTSWDYLDILKRQHGTDNERDIFTHYGLTIDGEPTREKASYKASTAPTDEPEPSPVEYMPYFLQSATTLQNSPEGQRYIMGRGISLETSARFMLGYDSSWRHPKTPETVPTTARIIIPTGKSTYTARDINPDAAPQYAKQKVKGGDSVDGNPLYNAKALKSADSPCIFIVEGELDALSVIEAGGQAIAIGSTTNASKFIKAVEETPPTVPLVLSLDNDESGSKAQATIKKGLEALKLPFIEVDISGEYKDPNEHLQRDRGAFIACIADPEEQARAEAEAEKKKYLETSAAHHVTAFMGEVNESANTPAISTGFDKLDTALDGGLYPGLYIIGAISSLGKTTLILQTADQIAQRGHDVMIFSLEMSRYELMAKSISRLTIENCDGNPRNAKTTRGILAGTRWKNYSRDEMDLIKRSISAYYDYSGRIFIHEGVGNIGVEQMKQEVQRHITFTGNIPVVLIDYLQIIAPHDERATDKQIVDRAVLELKRMSRDKKVTVIAVSSFNRDNYQYSVNMASFKESGAIEYSSDVLLGLQLAGMDGLKQSDTQKATNIKQIEQWKTADPRKAQLKILKNRNGKMGESLYFDYYPMFNKFTETDDEDLPL